MGSNWISTVNADLDVIAPFLVLGPMVIVADVYVACVQVPTCLRYNPRSWTVTSINQCVGTTPAKAATLLDQRRAFYLVLTS